MLKRDFMFDYYLYGLTETNGQICVTLNKINVLWDQIFSMTVIKLISCS